MVAYGQQWLPADLNRGNGGEGKKKEAGAKQTFHHASISSKAENKYFIQRSVHQQIYQEAECPSANHSILSV